MRRARAKLKGYRPSAPAAGDFRAQQLALCVRAVEQSSYAAEKEVAIGFGRPGADEVLADLVAMQVRAILDIAWMCWANRAQGERDVAAGLPPDAVPLLGRHVPRLRRPAARLLRRAVPPPGGGGGARETAGMSARPQGAFLVFRKISKKPP